MNFVNVKYELAIYRNMVMIDVSSTLSSTAICYVGAEHIMFDIIK